MSLGYVYLILMAAITLAFALSIEKWMHAPADRYDTLLEKMELEKNAQRGENR